MKKLFLITLAALAALNLQAQSGEEMQSDVNQYGQVVTSVPVNATLQDGILVLQNKKQNYKMWFDIRVQGDAAVYFGYDSSRSVTV